MPILSPSRDELTPLLPHHAQPRPEARTWWGRNWRPIRFFCVIAFVCWFVVPWIWGAVWWALDGGFGDGGGSGGERWPPGRGPGRSGGERRVGIVGAGPAGIATALALSKQKDHHGNPKYAITIIEQKSTIGGRMVLGFDLNSPSFHGIEIEDVASAELFPKDSVIRERVEEVAGLGAGYGKGTRGGEGRSAVGFFGGREISARLTRPSSRMGWGEWLTLVFRYGGSVWRARHLSDGTEKMVAEMLKVGSLQHQNRNGRMELKQPEDTLRGIVNAAGLGEVVAGSAQDRISKNGISEAYVKDILAPQVRRQIGQDVDEVSEFALRGALDRECGSAGRSSVIGDFEGVMRNVVEKSKAELQLNARVVGLRRDVGGLHGREGWSLDVRREDGRMDVQFFDQVVVAAPCNFSTVLSDVPSRVDDGEQREVFYRGVYVTFVLSTGMLDPKYFESAEPLPDEILFNGRTEGRLNQKEKEIMGIRELSHVRRIYGPDFLSFEMEAEKEGEGNVEADAVHHLYRLLSDHPLDDRRGDGILKKMFGRDGGIVAVKSAEVKDAYPLMWPRREGELGGFKVREGLWWTGVDEEVGSGVELAWVVGEVVAGLVG
ncbi:hypothetical protein IFR05_014180, partial [Cadophora sp. M221]